MYTSPLQTYLPRDFAPRWKRRLDELFVELLGNHLTGYPVAWDHECAIATLRNCLSITNSLGSQKAYVMLLRAAGCFVVITRIANTEVPFPGTMQTWARQSWEEMKKEARRIAERFK